MSHYALRVPDSLLARARKVAEQDHTSINQFFIVAIAEKLASLESVRLYIAQRAERANPKAVLDLLTKVKDREVAYSGDRIGLPARRRSRAKTK
jgi:hypothetical protein